jgi:hypothetical protein
VTCGNTATRDKPRPEQRVVLVSFVVSVVLAIAVMPSFAGDYLVLETSCSSGPSGRPAASCWFGLRVSAPAVAGRRREGAGRRGAQKTDGCRRGHRSDHSARSAERFHSCLVTKVVSPSSTRSDQTPFHSGYPTLRPNLRDFAVIVMCPPRPAAT